MSRTSNHAKARHLRKVNKAWLYAINTGDEPASTSLDKVLKTAELSAHRYGNKRKYMADEKVRERRLARREANQCLRHTETNEDPLLIEIDEASQLS